MSTATIRVSHEAREALKGLAEDIGRTMGSRWSIAQVVDLMLAADESRRAETWIASALSSTPIHDPSKAVNNLSQPVTGSEQPVTGCAHPVTPCEHPVHNLSHSVTQCDINDSANLDAPHMRAGAGARSLPPSLPPENYVEGEERQASGARAYEPPPPPPSYVDESEPPGAGLEAVDWIKAQWNQRARRNPALVAARIVHESAVLEAWRAHPDRESWSEALDHIAAKPAEWLTHYRLTTLAGAVRISERFKLPKIFAALNGEYEERFDGSARASPSSQPNVTRMIPPGRKPLFEAANDEPGQTYEIPHSEWQ